MAQAKTKTITHRNPKSAPKSKKTAKARSKNTGPDDALIRECVGYVQNVAAFHAGFKADPGGNSEFAEPAGTKFAVAYHAALHKIGKMSAVTAEGVHAKARMAPFVLEDDSGGFETASRNFFFSFAADVKRFFQSVPATVDAPAVQS